MTPTWFPWILIGGICFILFGFIGSKYKEKSYQRLQFLQDFVSGSILITLVGITMPDLFPEISFPSSLTSSISSESHSDDMIQVGPPRLMRRSI
jgi:hypothetical protein